MIVPDTNLLIYAFNRDAPLHTQAAAWWEELLNGRELVGIPWVVMQAFVRLLSSRTVVRDPYSTAELFDICDEWLSIDVVSLLEPTESTYQTWRELMTQYQLPGTMSTDALIAAEALSNNATVHSNDGDFLRFKGLQLVNPMVS